VGPEGHAFGTQLTGQELDFGPIQARWSNLPNEQLEAYLSAFPPQWDDAHDAMLAALTHIRTVRDRIEACLAELKRALS
jgi:hypothetical protein